MKTKIEWATDVWNPVTGCTKISEGCAHCYAEGIARRFWGERKFTDVQCHGDRVGEPYHWRKTRRVFVNSMSDLFHPDVPDEFIMWVWLTMIAANEERDQKHTFMILTKRPERMHAFLKGAKKYDDNIWLGVTAENQRAADERIPLLLDTPAAVRFVSVEPMLGPVDLDRLKKGHYTTHALSGWMTTAAEPMRTEKLDWVICGGETGPGARPMNSDWARSLRDQCVAANVPFFFKRWGASEGRIMDGREWNEIPEAAK